MDDSQINGNGGPAFPVLDSNLNDGRHGMSLLDWFAGMAMNASLNADFEWYDQQSGDRLDSLANLSYDIAYAMLEARNVSK